MMVLLFPTLISSSEIAGGSLNIIFWFILYALIPIFQLIMIKSKIIYENYMKILFIKFSVENKIKLIYFRISIIQNIPIRMLMEGLFLFIIINPRPSSFFIYYMHILQKCGDLIKIK